MTDARPLKLFFDGGCRPNPGAMETAVVARGIAWFGDAIGTGDNNDAEWLALIHALRVAAELGAVDIVLVGDSALVVNQANGLWPCRSAGLLAHRAVYAGLAAGFARVRVRRVGRAQNLAGIALQKRRGLRPPLPVPSPG